MHGIKNFKVLDFLFWTTSWDLFLCTYQICNTFWSVLYPNSNIQVCVT